MLKKNRMEGTNPLFIEVNAILSGGGEGGERSVDGNDDRCLSEIASYIEGKEERWLTEMIRMCGNVDCVACVLS